MSYTVQYSNTSKTPIEVADSTIDHTTSIFLVGSNSSNYGLSIASNFVHMLENFASPIAPSNAIEGQLWYDTSLPSNKKLKIYDGAAWIPTNGVYQSSTIPSNNKPGDIWVDTATSKLSIWNGTTWVEVGPAVSLGGKNGTYTTTLNDNIDGNSHSVILSYINDEIITIISKDNFTPNPVILGFTQLSPGLNVSTKTFDGYNAQIKGTSYSALNLIIPGESSPISGSSFLRSDTPGIIEGFLRLNSNSGIRIGSDIQTVYLEKQINNAVLSSRADGSKIGLSIVKNGSLNQIFTVDGNNLRVGVNTTVPDTELHVVGSAKISNKLIVNSTDADSIVVSGGASIAKNLTVTKDLLVTENSSVGGLLTVGVSGTNGPSIVPSTANMWDLGTALLPFRNIYANQIINNTLSLSFVSTGMIVRYAGSGAIPDGWLLCDGAEYLRSEYLRLFGIIGIEYGASDETHFSVPLITVDPGSPRSIIKY